MSLLNKNHEEYQLLDTAREILRNPIFGVVEKVNSFYSKSVSESTTISLQRKRKTSEDKNGKKYNQIDTASETVLNSEVNGTNKTINPYKVLELEKVELRFNENAKPYITIDIELNDYEKLRNNYVIPYLNNDNVSFELTTSSGLLESELHYKKQLIVYAGKQFSISLPNRYRHIGYIENFNSKELGKFKRFSKINNQEYLVMIGQTYNLTGDKELHYDGCFGGFFQFRLIQINKDLIDNIRKECGDFHYIENMNFKPKHFILNQKYYANNLKQNLDKIIKENNIQLTLSD